MSKVREVSGGDANTQLHLEVKSMKRSDREELLSSAGNQHTVQRRTVCPSLTDAAQNVSRQFTQTCTWK